MSLYCELGTVGKQLLRMEARSRLLLEHGAFTSAARDLAREGRSHIYEMADELAVALPGVGKSGALDLLAKIGIALRILEV